MLRIHRASRLTRQLAGVEQALGLPRRKAHVAVDPTLHAEWHAERPKRGGTHGPLSFNDPAQAYRGVKTSQLAFSLLVSSMCAVTPVTTNANRIIDAATSLGLRPIVNAVIRRTIFKQYCGGESIFELLDTCEGLSRSGILPVLDYAAEWAGDAGDASAMSPRGITGRFTFFESTVDNTLDCIKAASSHPRSMVAVKVTGLCDPNLLELISRTPGILRRDARDAVWEHDREDPPDEWEADEGAAVLVRRIGRLCAEAEGAGVQLLIDAEHYSTQPAVDALVTLMQERYNRRAAVVSNTYQAYLKGTDRRIKLDVDAAAAGGYILGAKLVRGAYMQAERERAKVRGYSSPIHDCKEDTDECFNRCLDSLVEAASEMRACVMVATHNQESIERAAAAMTGLRMDPWGPRAARTHGRPVPDTTGQVSFAQLLGMSDHLTSTLAAGGYIAYKYVPFGPLDMTLPYLTRRARENVDVLGGDAAVRERAMMRTELGRRLLGQWRL